MKIKYQVQGELVKKLAIGESRHKAKQATDDGKSNKIHSWSTYNNYVKVSDDDYKSMSEDFATERKTLESEISELNAKFETQKSKASGIDAFVALAKKYSDISEINAEIINAFIEKIIIHEKVKTDSGVEQEIEFVFRGVGKINL